MGINSIADTAKENVNGSLMSLVSAQTAAKTSNSKTSFSSLIDTKINSSNVSNSSAASNNSSEARDIKNKDTTEIDKSIADEHKFTSVQKKSQAKDTGSTQQDEFSDKLVKLAGKIKEKIKNVLGVDDEELNSLMSSMNFGMLDLLDSKNLSALVSNALTGSSDTSALLTDEKASDVLTGLLSDISDMISDSGIDKDMLKSVMDDSGLKDQINALLENVSSKESADVSHAENGLSDQNAKDAKTDGLELSENGKENQDKTVIAADRLTPKDSNLNENQNDTEKSDSNENTKIAFSVSKQNDAKESDSDSFLSEKGTSSENTSNLSAPQTQNELAAQFIENLGKAVQTESINADGSVTDQTDISDIAGQIISRIKVIIKPETTSMSMELTPESLGRISLNITSKNGAMTASFTTSTEQAKAAIESQMSSLIKTLDEQGIKVDAVEVEVGYLSEGMKQDNSADTGSSDRENGSASKRNHKFISSGDYENISMEEAASKISEMLMDGTSTVDYSA